MIRSMLVLSDEMLLSIIEAIEDLNGLRSLALTCSYLQTLVEPFIYHSILVRTRRDALALANSIVNRSDRLGAIQTIESRQKLDPGERGLDETRCIGEGSKD